MRTRRRGPARGVDSLHDLEGGQPLFARRRAACGARDRAGEIEKLALEGLERNRHGVRGAARDGFVDGRGLAFVVLRIALHIPCGEFVACDIAAVPRVPWISTRSE